MNTREIVEVLRPLCKEYDATHDISNKMAAILIVPRIANSEKVQTVGNHLYDLAVEWMEELRPAKNKKEGAK